MLNTDLTKNGNELIVKVDGSLDTKSAPILDKELSTIDEDIDTVIFDYSGLTYISSSGLRVMVKILKMPGTRKRVKVRHANDTILEILGATGLDEFMEIE